MTEIVNIITSTQKPYGYLLLKKKVMKYEIILLFSSELLNCYRLMFICLSVYNDRSLYCLSEYSDRSLYCLSEYSDRSVYNSVGDYFLGPFDFVAKSQLKSVIKNEMNCMLCTLPHYLTTIVVMVTSCYVTCYCSFLISLS